MDEVLSIACSSVQPPYSPLYLPYSPTFTSRFYDPPPPSPPIPKEELVRRIKDDIEKLSEYEDLEMRDLEFLKAFVRYAEESMMDFAEEENKIGIIDSRLTIIFEDIDSLWKGVTEDFERDRVYSELVEWIHSKYDDFIHEEDDSELD